MKIKEGFMLREVAGSYVVIPVGEASKNFKCMINLNSTGAFLFEKLKKGVSNIEELVKMMQEEYDVNEEIANRDAQMFVQKLQEANILE